MQLQIPCQLRGRDDSGQEFSDSTTTLNLSAGGALVASPRRLVPGSHLSLEVAPVSSFHLQESVQTSHPLAANVVWARSTPKAYLVGIRFSTPLRV